MLLNDGASTGGARPRWGRPGAVQSNLEEMSKMPFIASDPKSYLGKVVGNGHCVAYVNAAAGAPETSRCKRGKLVKGANIAKSTAIVTFSATGAYTNAADGS